jgi:aspartyl-tRNA(Asn)/glutamyl-tRNA(Gln) amidotransferase subunit C
VTDNSSQPKPAEISRQDVIRVAELAKVGLDEAEIEPLRGQLSAILENMAVLNELDTSTIAATAQVIPLSNVFRPDLSRPSLTPAEALANAPDSQEDSFKVAVVLEEDEALRMDHPAVP